MINNTFENINAKNKLGLKNIKWLAGTIHWCESEFNEFELPIAGSNLNQRFKSFFYL